MIELLKIHALVRVARVLAFFGLKAEAEAEAEAVVTRASRRVGELVKRQARPEA